jgi:hypothetical protein
MNSIPHRSLARVGDDDRYCEIDVAYAPLIASRVASTSACFSFLRLTLLRS